MLRLGAGQVESLWDAVMPLEVLGAAGRSRADRRAAGRPGAARTGHRALAVGGRAAWMLGGEPRPADDRDGDLCAADGRQAAHWLGL